MVPEQGGRKIYQSQLDRGDGKMVLLRAIVIDDVDPAVVVTPYQTKQISEAPVKVTYDPEVDVLYILLRSVPIEESDEEKPGVILDYDKTSNVVGIEILDASKRIDNPRSVEYAIEKEKVGQERTSAQQ